MQEPSAEVLNATAYHEAGHAVLIVILGYKIEYITILTDEANQPSVKPANPGEITPEHWIMIASAGAQSLEVFNIPSDDTAGGIDDAGKIVTLLDKLYPEDCDSRKESVRTQLSLEVGNILRTIPVRKAITALVRILLDRGAISGDDAHRIIGAQLDKGMVGGGATSDGG